MLSSFCDWLNLYYPHRAIYKVKRFSISLISVVAYPPRCNFSLPMTNSPPVSPSQGAFLLTSRWFSTNSLDFHQNFQPAKTSHYQACLPATYVKPLLLSNRQPGTHNLKSSSVLVVVAGPLFSQAELNKQEEQTIPQQWSIATQIQTFPNSPAPAKQKAVVAPLRGSRIAPFVGGYGHLYYVKSP